MRVSKNENPQGEYKQVDENSLPYPLHCTALPAHYVPFPSILFFFYSLLLPFLLFPYLVMFFLLYPSYPFIPPPKPPHFTSLHSKSPHTTINLRTSTATTARISGRPHDHALVDKRQQKLGKKATGEQAEYGSLVLVGGIGEGVDVLFGRTEGVEG